MCDKTTHISPQPLIKVKQANYLNCFNVKKLHIYILFFKYRGVHMSMDGKLWNNKTSPQWPTHASWEYSQERYCEMTINFADFLQKEPKTFDVMNRMQSFDNQNMIRGQRITITHGETIM